MGERLKKFETAAIQAFDHAGYSELFGVTFSRQPDQWQDAHKNVLLKFMTANNDDVQAAKEQLVSTLEWRRDYHPLKAASEEHDPKLEKLGVITKAPTSGRIVTWNLYGAVENPEDLFEDVERFVRWRVGLMERGLSLIDFADATRNQMDQIHDYNEISFLRMPATVRATSRKVIQLFQSYYPDMLSAKYFINIPTIMMWVFKIISRMSDSATRAKFHALANGSELYQELGDWVPPSYGGIGPPLDQLAITPQSGEDGEVESLD